MEYRRYDCVEKSNSKKKCGKKSEKKTMIEELLRITQDAAQEVLAIYHENASSLICLKDDGSPLTRADMAAHKIILSGLEAAFPGIPVVSEEGCGRLPLTDARAPFFLVDPIDGTTDYLKRTGEFTLNIALVEGGLVKRGVVCAPALSEMFWGVAGEGAFKNGERIERPPLDLRSPPAPLRALVSVSHRDSATDACLSPVPSVEAVCVGSSLKFCRLAEGWAHYYPRATRLHEWDIAAGHAVLKAAGGNVFELGTKNEVRYGNPDFEAPCFEAY
jgi:3'(2'),5'-bisphosphate nucleotidase